MVELLAELRESRVTLWISLGALACQLEPDADGNQALLGAVVEVPLDPLSLVCDGSAEPPLGQAQGLPSLAKLLVETAILQRHDRRLTGRLE